MRTKRARPSVLAGPVGTVATRVGWATTFFARLRGVLRRSPLDEDEALVLVPCRQVHTFGLAYPLDAIFCDAGLRVVHVETLAPATISRRVAAAKMCIELRGGRAAESGIRPGTRLELRDEP